MKETNKLKINNDDIIEDCKFVIAIPYIYLDSNHYLNYLKSINFLK